MQGDQEIKNVSPTYDQTVGDLLAGMILKRVELYNYSLSCSGDA